MRARQSGYVSICGLLIRKLVLAFVVLVGFVLLAAAAGKAVPQSFLPDEDQGYFMINVELPEAASLQRTVVVMRKIEAILKTEPALRYSQRYRRLQHPVADDRQPQCEFTSAS